MTNCAVAQRYLPLVSTKETSNISKVPVYLTPGICIFQFYMHVSEITAVIYLIIYIEIICLEILFVVVQGERYFLKCANYNNERITLFQCIRNFHPLNINVLLFGNDNLTIEENTNIFKAVQNF